MSPAPAEVEASKGPGVVRTWIFQANPQRYRILESLVVEREEYWNLNQYAKDVNVGDRILIWLSGEDAGIYAVGTVVTEPVVMSDSATGIGYWRDPREGRRAKPRVQVRYDRVLVGRPLRKVYIQADPALWELRILRYPRGTNFAVSEEEWRALREWLDDEG